MVSLCVHIRILEICSCIFSTVDGIRYHQSIRNDAVPEGDQHRIGRHEAYFRYVRDEALPEILGASFVSGGTALKRPERVFWGGYSGYLADPDRHVWELAFNPGWPLAADGGLTLREAAS